MSEITFSTRSHGNNSLQLAIVELRKDLDKAFYRISDLEEENNDLEKRVEELSKIIHERVSLVDNKIDQKTDWIVKLIGSVAVAVIVNLGWIVVTNSHITISPSTSTEPTPSPTPEPSPSSELTQ